MVFSLRRFEASGGEVAAGSGMPASMGARASQLVRIERIVELLMLSPNPKIEGIHKSVGCSRATVFRDLATPEFAAGLAAAVNNQLATRIGTAMAALMRMLEDDTTPVTTKFRTATWLIDRFDRLSKASGAAGGAAARGASSDGAGGMPAADQERVAEILRQRREQLQEQQSAQTEPEHQPPCGA